MDSWFKFDPVKLEQELKEKENGRRLSTVPEPELPSTRTMGERKHVRTMGS